MANGHGGKRTGAGRRVGSENKRTKEIAKKVGAEGITPLEIMVSAMRICWERAEREGHSGEHFPMAVSFAEKAAPYMHSKYAAIQHSGEVGGQLTVVVRKFTEDGADV